jgi:hypothetical protein
VLSTLQLVSRGAFFAPVRLSEAFESDGPGMERDSPNDAPRKIREFSLDTVESADIE